MFSDLDLIDWVALAIALLLLCVAAIAALLARSAGRREPLGQHRPVSTRYSPSHASSNQVDGALGIYLVDHEPAPPKPGHAVIPGISPSAPAHAAPQGSKPLPFAKPGKHTATSGGYGTSAGAHAAEPGQTPPPLPMLRSSAPAHLEVSEPLDLLESAPSTEVLDLTDDSHTEHLAERAARLRGRPVSEAESQRRPAEAGTPGYRRREPGFFADPIGRHELRYWNGSSWTEYAKEGSERVIDPI